MGWDVWFDGVVLVVVVYYDVEYVERVVVVVC